MPFKLAAILLSLLHGFTEGTVPSKPFYFDDQLVYHSPSSSSSSPPSTDHTNPEPRWTHRYYASNKFFSGPGSPIFLIMGGEGAIEPSTGLMYPFIAEHLAKDFGAFVLQPEHRFYGESQPLGTDFEFGPNTSDITTALMTSEQAMWDAVRLVRFVQNHLGCSYDRHDFNYCPVITVGGSYPGFLSAMMRVRHPDVVDMSYAASAPMKFYSQEVGEFDYYNHITLVAEKSSAGCADAVRSTLVDGLGELIQGIQSPEDIVKVASQLSICPNTVPEYIIDGQTFYDELIMVVGYTFANYNMANYPPDKSTTLYHACQIFQNEELSPARRLAQFLATVDTMAASANVHSDDVSDGSKSISTSYLRANSCFNMKSQLPSGINGTISAGDWSGVGTGHNGQMWDFQTCTLLVEQIGFSTDSMFPSRPWTFEWMYKHCLDRFGVRPDAFKLTREWRFDDLENAGASHILFTNGLNDGWSVGGIQSSISETLLVLNFENGAHHSDLSALGPSDKDTDDIRNGFKDVKSILKTWLDEIKPNKDDTVLHLHESSDQLQGTGRVNSLPQAQRD